MRIFQQQFLFISQKANKACSDNRNPFLFTSKEANIAEKRQTTDQQQLQVHHPTALDFLLVIPKSKREMPCVEPGALQS